MAGTLGAGALSAVNRSRLFESFDSRRPSDPTFKSSSSSTSATSMLFKSAPNHFPVWEVRSTLALQDPDMPAGRLHHAFFVQTHSGGSGYLHHIVGDIASPGGMQYQRIQSSAPEKAEAFVFKTLLGWTATATYPDAWNTLLTGLPLPPQQKAFNPATRKTEPFKEKLGEHAYVFYADGEPRRPLWKCTEWTEKYALPALRENGLIASTEEIGADPLWYEDMLDI